METLRQQGFSAALQNQALILGVLKRYQITPAHPEFDDYYQESLLTYVAAYCQYQRSHQHISQANYIYTKVRQRVIDLLRQRDCYTRHFGADSALEPSTDQESQWLQRLQLQQLLSALEKDERRLLMLLYHENRPVPEICATLQISRRTLYRKRKKILAKLKKVAQKPALKRHL
uniref:Uncharacterized protein n=1 Tax=Loigolactobacillus rennini TaxID=238013 RepID=A0A1K2I9M4_9LACO|nr:unknown [Loigolactobacillus rennini]